MTRLIDTDPLKVAICSNVYPMTDDFNNRDYGMFWTGGIEKAIDEQPTIEAVPVVRCKDCKYCTEHYDTDGNVPWWGCSEWDSGTDSDGFCYLGERRDNEAD